MPNSSPGPKGSASITVSTLAGQQGVMGSRDGTGTGASLSMPVGIVASGLNLYFTDTSNSTIRQIAISSKAVTTIAGVAGAAGYFDNASYPVFAAYFWNPEGIATDGTNLYITDSGNNAIRKIVIATGAVSTIAGNPNVAPGSSDGTGSGALFSNPLGICYVGPNTLYVVDSGNSTIRKVTISTGVVTTVAGNPNSQGSRDGPGLSAMFTWPQGIATDGTNLYVADSGNGTIRKIVIATDAVSTIAGTPGVKGDVDGTGSGAAFNWPEGIAADGLGNLYVADTLNSAIRKVGVSSGAVTTYAGQGEVTGSADGGGDSATFNHPMRLFYSTPNLFVADTYNQTVRLVK
jgi:hypothetical protein